MVMVIQPMRTIDIMAATASKIESFTVMDAA
jgi:hypothetical protein